MKKIAVIYVMMIVLAGAFLLVNFNSKEACAGSKCRFNMTCSGNASTKATICTYDCSSSSTKSKVVAAFKKKCGSPNTPSNPKSGWENCDITIN